MSDPSYIDYYSSIIISVYFVLASRMYDSYNHTTVAHIFHSALQRVFRLVSSTICWRLITKVTIF